MKELLIGHCTLTEKGTGLTVFLFPQPACASVHLCGSAPATREFALLAPEASVDCIHGLMFSGGSAFGLDAAAGVMKWLAEKKIGIDVGPTVVPIVPAACIFDLDFKEAVAPTASDAYQACENAIANNELRGTVGAATGATVGKLVNDAGCMSGGFGHAHLTGPGDLKVSAYAVVNAVGDVLDENNNIIAGAQSDEGEFVNSEKQIQAGNILSLDIKSSIMNTTLVAITTNAKLNKTQAKRIAKMGSAGMARAITPSFTPLDGDVVYCVSLGDVVCDEMVLGSLAAEAVRAAIVNAVNS